MGRPKKNAVKPAKITNPIDALETAIETGNWSLVCDAFKVLSGKTLKPPAGATLVEERDDPYKQVCIQVLGYLNEALNLEPTATKIVEKKVEEVEDTEEVQEEALNPDLTEQAEILVEEIGEISAGPKGGLVSGIINAKKNKVVFPTNVLVNEDEKIVNVRRKKKVQKIKRPTYKPTMLKCTHCSKGFDLKKYPSAPVLSQPGEAREVKCPFCKERFPRA